MPRISDAFTDIAIYVYSCLDDAQRGAKQGGSGFLVHVQFVSNPEMAEVYVVTNDHVVRNARNPVIRLNRKDGTVECIPTEGDQWISHRNGADVSVLPLDTDFSRLKFISTSLEDFVTPQLVVDEDIGIGDDTVMVGRFIGHDGTQRNAPAVRFGNIAMMAQQEIIAEFGTRQESFLVEVRSLPGYSGSAVLIYSPCAMNDMSQRRFGKTREESKPKPLPRHGLKVLDLERLKPKGPYLLGIDWCHLQNRVSVRNRRGPHPEGWFVEENTGMAGVIPAWKIAELLNCEEVASMRKRQDDELTRMKSRSPVSLDYQENSHSKGFSREQFEAVPTVKG